MNKNIKYLILPLLFTLITSCSFGDKTGIWSGDKKEKERLAELEKRANIEIVKLYTHENIYSKEVSSIKNIILTPPKKNFSWKMSGLNLQNFRGNIFLPKIDNNFLKKKFGKNKFSISKITSSPITFENYIIFADDTGTIFNINKKGKLNWKNNIYKKIYKKFYKNLTFAIYNDKIYVADNIGFIYVISLNNGKLIWIKKHGIPLKSRIKIFDNNIYLVNQDNRLICLSADDGYKIWDIRAVPSFIKTQNFLALAISKEGELLVVNSAGDLIKVNAESGQIYWSLNTAISMLDQDTDFFESSDIIIDNDNIFFTTSSSIFSYSLIDGYLNWKEDIGSKNTPIIDGDNVFLISDNGYFVNLDKKTGKIIWSTNILKVLKKKKRMTKIVGFIMGSGKIYAISSNGYLIVSSAHSGKTEYFKKIGGTLTSAPIISDGSLYILTENSRILGFN